MDNTANPQSEPSTGDRVTDERTGVQAEPPPLAERRVWDELLDGLKSGAEDARTAAAKAIPKVKSAAASAVYWTAYGAAFAAVFNWTFAKGLAPDSLKAGLHQGAKSGAVTAEKWMERLKQPKAKAPDATSDQGSPSTEAIQPGLA